MVDVRPLDLIRARRTAFMLALVVAVVMASPGAVHATSAAEAPHVYDNLVGRSASAADDKPEERADQAVLEAGVDVDGKLRDYDGRAHVAYTSAGAERHVARGPLSDKVLGTRDAIVNSADPAGEPGWVRRAIQSPESGLVTPRAAGGLADDVASSGRYNRTTFNGNRVYQRDDLIDSSLVDARGRTNLERMQRGLAPIGPDGQSVNLHHLTQRQSGAIAEVTATMHQQNSRILHINPSSMGSGIGTAARGGDRLVRRRLPSVGS